MRLILSLAIALLTASCKNNQRIVTVYASQDQVYAEPILKQFEQQTGIRVRGVYDSEAVKTVGLVNRLIAERANPQCDVFWNNEELRTRQLESKGIVERWAAVGFRSRGMISNTNLLSSPPQSLIDLTNAVWKRKVALAYPLFGTTATHFLALRQQWGAEAWEHWCRALKANEPFLVDGNSVVVQLVGRGEALIGLTDSDDIAAGQKQGLPIHALPLGESTLLIPNTVVMIQGAPHPTEAQRLYEHLQSESVRKALIAASALEGDRPGHIGFKPDWVRLLADLEPATATLKTVFLR